MASCVHKRYHSVVFVFCHLVAVVASSSNSAASLPPAEGSPNPSFMTSQKTMVTTSTSMIKNFDTAVQRPRPSSVRIPSLTTKPQMINSSGFENITPTSLSIIRTQNESTSPGNVTADFSIISPSLTTTNVLLPVHNSSFGSEMMQTTSSSLSTSLPMTTVTVSLTAITKSATLQTTPFVATPTVSPSIPSRDRSPSTTLLTAIPLQTTPFVGNPPVSPSISSRDWSPSTTIFTVIFTAFPSFTTTSVSVKASNASVITSRIYTSMVVMSSSVGRGSPSVPATAVLSTFFAARPTETPRPSCSMPSVLANMTCPLGATCWSEARSQWLINFRTSDVCSECSPTQLHPIVVYSGTNTATMNRKLLFSTDGSYGRHLFIFRVPSRSIFNSCFLTEDMRLEQPNLTICTTASVFVRDLDPGSNYFAASIDETNTTSCSNGARIEIIVAENNCSNTSVATESVCSNRGPCIFDTQLGEFACRCPKGYTGMWCEEIDECYNNTICQNGGRCVDGNCTFECECVSGFGGAHCERDIDECLSNPCGGGEACREGVGGYSCVTVYEACEVNLCQHRGLCIRTPEKELCYCIDSYYGDRCEQEVDECLSRPCWNEASCHDGVANYTCVCSSGFTGRQCEIEVVCNTTTECLNGGTCDNHLCLCMEGYTGKKCESQSDPCSSSPCQYGGTCKSHMDLQSYTCSCPGGAVGHACDVFLQCSTTRHPVPSVSEVIPSPVANGSIRVSWHVDSSTGAGFVANGSIDNSTVAGFVLVGYLLEYSSVEGSFVRNATASASPLIIENLNHVAFQFRVAAVGVLNDQLVCSNYSDMSQPVFPKISKPSVEPRNVTVRQFGTDMLVVTWDPIDENLAGGSYLIHFSRLSLGTVGRETSKVTILKENGTRSVLNGVAADTWYKVKVSAVVTVDKTGIELTGPFSRAVWIKTQVAAGVPPPELDVIFWSSRGVFITWDLPSDTSVSLDQSVIVSINVFRQNTLVITNSLPFKQRSHFIRDLSPSTIYALTATLNISAGQSRQTDEIIFETNEEDKWNFTLSTYNATAIQVTWSVPTEYYTSNATVKMLASVSDDTVSVRRRRAFRSKRDVLVLRLARDEQAFMGGLQPFTVYKINFTVLYPNGTELYSREVYGVSGETAPSATRNVRVLSADDPTVAEVQWDEPLQPNGRVGYRLRYYGNSSFRCSAARERVVDAVENRRWLITDLKLFENYTFMVMSYNLLHNISCCQSDAEANSATTFETPSSRLNPPESIIFTSLPSGGINISWENSHCRHGRATSVHVFYALVVTDNDRQVYPLIFRQTADLTKTDTTTYYINGSDIDRNKTYAIWLHLDDGKGQGYSSEIVFRNSLLKYPESVVLGLLVKHRTTSNMTLQWGLPREESLNDDTAIYVYSITWQSLSVPHTPKGPYHYYSDKSLTEDGLDSYTVVDLSPSQEYKVCVSVATISKEDKRLLVGQAECAINETDYQKPLANLFDLSLSKCPSGEIPVDPIAVEWDLNGQKQPGPIDPKSIILEYRPEDEKKPAVLSCADARFHNASCMPPADGLRWCRWMVSKEKAHCNVTGLTAYTFYTFKLTAGNSKGNAMKQVQNRTCLDRPDSSKPHECQIHSHSNGSFSTLIWVIGQKNAPDVNYTLIWNDVNLHNSSIFVLDHSLIPLNQHDPITCKKLSKSVANCTIRSVTEGHSYRYRIISTTQVGNASSEEDSCEKVTVNSVIHSDDSGRTVTVTAGVVSVSVVFIAAVAVVLLYYIYRWKPKKELQRELDDNILREFELSRGKIDVCDYVHQLGSGSFGCVFMGWISPEKGENERVAVKELRKDVTLDVKRDFIREAKISLRVKHPNVVSLRYVCSQDEPYLMIMECLNRGSLKSLLKLLEPVAAEQTTSTFTALKCDIIAQVACGLEAISNENIIHRDIAARNCLVHDSGDKLIIKVSDFGLAVAMDEELREVRLKRGGGQLPFWWMSPEASYEGRYSEKSDVWSFGVLCWEVYSCGIQPYYWLSDFAHRYMANRLPLPPLPFRMKTKTGVILPFPDEIQILLTECWNMDADERPPFQQIVKILRDIANTFDARQLATDVTGVQEKMSGGTVNEFDDMTAL